MKLAYPEVAFSEIRLFDRFLDWPIIYRPDELWLNFWISCLAIGLNIWWKFSLPQMPINCQKEQIQLIVNASVELLCWTHTSIYVLVDNSSTPTPLSKTRERKMHSCIHFFRHKMSSDLWSRQNNYWTECSWRGVD